MLGKEILGYHVDEKIGSGGFGTVYKVSKTNVSGTYVRALKHITLPKKKQYLNILNSMGGDQTKADNYFADILENIVSEIKILSDLSESGNKNIVRYYENDIIENTSPKTYDIYILMEYLTPFTDYLDSEDLTVKDVIKLGKDILNALIACHGRNIIHRDIKDDNIFVASDGTYKIGDFGVSKALKDQSRAASIKGTPNFIAPEVYLGKENYDHTVDLYSLGIVLYRLLNNSRNPFLPTFPNAYTSEDEDIAFEARMTGKTPELPNMAKNELGEVILKAIKPRNERYNTAKEFFEALENAEKTLAPIYLVQGIGIFNVSQESEETVAFSNLDADVTIAASMFSGQAEEQNGNDDSDLFKTIGLFDEEQEINFDKAVAIDSVGEQKNDLDKIVIIENNTVESHFQNVKSNNSAEETSKVPTDRQLKNLDESNDNFNKKKRKKTVIIAIVTIVILVALIVGLVLALNLGLFDVLHNDSNDDVNNSINTGILIHTHTGGIKNCEETAVCTICGESYKHTQEITHSGSIVWMQTENLHEAQYSCCNKISVAKSNHSWDNGNCLVCGYTCNHLDSNKDHKCDRCSYKTSHSYKDGKCTFCGEPVYSKNLEYTIIDKKEYSLVGMGSCTDTEIFIPEIYNGLPVTSIGENAFKNQSKIVSVVIPNTVKSIKSYAFLDCKNLTQIVFPKDLTGLGYEILHNTAYYNNEENWENDILYIDNNLLCARPTLAGSYSIKEGTTIIANGAFYNCSKLTDIKISDSVSVIGYEAFLDCTGLVSVTIPNNVKHIGDLAFKNCYFIESVKIGSGVKSIGEESFELCYRLTGIYVDENNLFYKDIGGNLYTKDGSTLMQYAIGNTSQVFNIPESVLRVGNSAFFGANHLKEIVISKNVASIGLNSIHNCNSLEKIIVDKNNSLYKDLDGNLYSKDGKILIKYATAKLENNFDIPNGVVIINDCAFQYCKNLASVVIPNSVTSIYFRAFDGCSMLSSITMPKSVIEIGIGAFYGCEKLNGITINDGVTKIERETFAYCKSLTSISIPYTVTNIDNLAFYSCINLLEIKIPDSVTSLGLYAFYNCDSLTSVTIPGSVNSVGGGAFESCDNLTEVNVSYGVTQLGDYVFYNCSKLENITISKTVTLIGIYAFHNCDSLVEFTIPRGLKNISEGLLYSCDNLVKVIIPDGIINIGDYVFAKCPNLQSVVMPNSLVSLYTNVFLECTSLINIEIPSSVISIGSNAFYNCTALESVQFGNIVGWQAGTANIAPTDLENKEIAAEYLKSTYCNCMWKRS